LRSKSRNSFGGGTLYWNIILAGCKGCRREISGNQIITSEKVQAGLIVQAESWVSCSLRGALCKDCIGLLESIAFKFLIPPGRSMGIDCSIANIWSSSQLHTA